MADRILVPFAGPGSGTGELTWGQRGIWGAIQAGGGPHNMGGVVPLPHGTTVDDIVATLRYAIGRHQALRTRYQPDPDGGPPHQVLSETGELPVDFLDATDDPNKVAAQEWQRGRATAFDYEHDWPVRVTLIRHRNVVTHMVATFCHLATDENGLQALYADLANADKPDPPPVNAIQPLALAARQQGAIAQRQQQSSLRHWSSLLRTIRARRLGESSDRRTPRYWELCCDTPAGYRAERVIAARERVDTSPVLLAAYAVSCATLTGDGVFVAQSMVSNRFRPASRTRSRR